MGPRPKSTKTSNRVVCDMCSAIFHVKCIPAKHQQHVPEDLRIDLFICHVCYKEDNNDDTLDLSSERNSEDSGDDAQKLYDMIVEHKKKKCY
ncbi:unnamed protein product [Pieris macdunnoughi]|uniref:Uncharacterized protein n=1 Tax=Pieris macdunnoughi TaxID=345717 RepID=A0A821XLD3_9NEOP|nr:unnamed protein product [Pieris macdunnoughi]